MRNSYKKMLGVIYAGVILLTSFSQAFAGTSANFATGAGLMKVGQATDTCTTTIKGAVRWNDTALLVEVCDGVQWAGLTVALPAAPTPTYNAGTGYFVLTSGTWDGNLVAAAASGAGTGLDAADDLCLADLTANDWMGKTTATSNGWVNEEHVQAFLLNGGSGVGYGHYGYPSKTYAFALSGDNTKGGATFTVNSGGNGPNNANAWNGATYFGGTYQYWTGMNAISGTLWNTNGFANCSGWTSNSNAVGGYVGVSTGTDQTRWTDAGTTTCNNLFHLICWVHP